MSNIQDPNKKEKSLEEIYMDGDWVTYIPDGIARMVSVDCDGSYPFDLIEDYSLDNWRFSTSEEIAKEKGVKMSRLKGMKCYLAGPIQCAVDFGHGWRKEITPFLEKMGVTVFNPLNPIFDSLTNLDEIMRPHMVKLRDEEKWDELRVEVKKMVRADLHMVDLSSFVIVNYDVSVPMCGTYEELFTANKMNKPVLMVVKDKKKLPLWMYGRIPTRSHIFESWESLQKYLTGINEDPEFPFEPADTKRWLFFSEQFKVGQFGEDYDKGDNKCQK